MSYKVIFGNVETILKCTKDINMSSFMFDIVSIHMTLHCLLAKYNATVSLTF